MNKADLTVIVLNNHCSAQGGASRVAIDEAIDIANSGIRTIFLGAVGPVCDELKKSPVQVICLGQSELAEVARHPTVLFQGLWNRTAHRVLNKLLARLSPENTLVHLHGFTQALSSSPVRCAFDLNFSVLYTMHDFFFACPTGTFFDFGSDTPCTRRALSLDCVTTNCDKRLYAHKVYRVARAAVQLRLGGLPRNVKNYISLSTRSADLLKPYLPQDAHVYALRNPIGIDKGLPVDVATNSGFLAIGRLDREKGIDTLVQAAVATGTRVTFVGDGPMRGLVEGTGLCEVTGWLSRADVLARMESARCLVFPSRWYETYGLAVSEAAARGVPAIVSDISAAAERVENNVTGWHMRSGDAADLARCLRIAGDDGSVRAAGSEAYRRWWSNPATRANHVTGLLEIYEDILDRRRGRGGAPGV
jgi:glycosyltransferase involved in cell wall biosynthesis